MNSSHHGRERGKGSPGPDLSKGMRDRLDGGFRLLTMVLVAVTALTLAFCASGCGLETEKANQALNEAFVFQEEAESILARLRNFPAEWQTVFSAPRSETQIAQARQLIVDRKVDVEALEATMEEWRKALEPVMEMNVDEKVKEFVRLKTDSIKCFIEYVSDYLTPVIDEYGVLVELVAQAQPNEVLNAKAEEISGLVLESTAKLEECEGAQKQADSYFRENKLGVQE